MKALASDIDGTLVFNQQIKKQDKEAIEKYQKEHLFGVCSGRPRCALFDLEKLKLDFYILSSGAEILDKDLNIIQDFPMKKEIFNEYHQHAQIILQTGNADVFYTTLKEDYNPKLKVISSFKKVEHEIIYGISLVFKDDKITKKACFEINQKYQEVEGFQNRNSVDIVRKGCSKGTGIKIIKDHYRLEKIAGIGDSYNDLPMLKVVDTAFTFKTSPQEIKKQVHYCVNDIAEAIALLEVEK
jgi:Cof subfamily protein (haloacid dehalogenase superfamily)